MDIVSAVRAALAERLGQRRFDVWFGTAARFQLDGRALTVGLPNSFFVDFVRANFRDHVEEACRAALGDVPTLAFRVETLDQDDAQAALPLGSPARAGGAASNHGNGTAPSNGGGASNVASGGGSRGACRRPAATLESFVAGATNRLALASAEMVARCPGQITPLVLHGPTGVGKTHLLDAVLHAVRRTRPQLAAVYLSAEQFTSHFLEALRGSGLPSFRSKYRGVELLVVDDLHFLAGKRATQVEMLHTIDTLLRGGKQLVFAADRPPNELSDFAPELIARLQSGMVCRIEPPDYPTRLGIVAQMASRMALSVPPEVQQFVASQLSSHARELSGALCRLKAACETLGRPLSLDAAREALGEMIRQSCRVVRLGDIERAVCTAFGVEPAALHSDAKAKSVSHPRMLAMWLARKHTRAALSEIGRYFGRRSHSTVISASKQVDRWMASGRPLELSQRAVSVDEAIEQVERQLRAG